MLTRLELIGFKSFADRTRFDFARGITAIVGPNGSGKSNIVDAVRWLLGEQSAKNLRGGEMTDVIFNGSSSRKSLGMAEVTMTFDNRRRILNTDSDDVQVSRRVFRDGEGEYLINGQTVRLKDIRELFIGSGAGQSTYNIIEQGRVDALLSASTKDRRFLFEDAAGISKFRVKKLETLRKLESVDVDLTRVIDILTELEKQLRTLKLQASKAKQYQAYHQELKSLRVTIAKEEVAKLNTEIAQEQANLERLRRSLESASHETTTVESDLRNIESQIATSQAEATRLKSLQFEYHERIAIQTAQADARLSQFNELQSEAQHCGKRLVVLLDDLSRMNADHSKLQVEQQQVRNLAEQLHVDIQNARSQITAISNNISQLNQEIESCREKQFQLVGEASKYNSDVETLQTLHDRMQSESERRRADLMRYTSRLNGIESAIAELSKSDADVASKLRMCQDKHAECTAERSKTRDSLDTLESSMLSLRDRRSTIRGQIDLLTELLRSHEGLGDGVRHMLSMMQSNPDVASQWILGMFADLITVPEQYVRAIETVIGDHAERFVVKDDECYSSIISWIGTPPGKVGFLSARFSNFGDTADARLSTHDALYAPTLVRVASANVASLVRLILNNVYIVNSTAEALAFSRLNPGARCVTVDGTISGPHGEFIIGGKQSSSGILSRRAELTRLITEAEQIELQLEHLAIRQQDLLSFDSRIASQSVALDTEIEALSGTAGTLRDQLLEQRQVQQQLSDAIALANQELAILASDIQRTLDMKQSAMSQSLNIMSDANQVRQELAQYNQMLHDLTIRRDEQTSRLTEIQVTHGRYQEHFRSLTEQLASLSEQIQQRQTEYTTIRHQRLNLQYRLSEYQLEQLVSSSTLSDFYYSLEDCAASIEAILAQAQSITLVRDALTKTIKDTNHHQMQTRQQIHSHELALQALTSRRDQTVSRILDDYQIDILAELPLDADNTSSDPFTSSLHEHTSELRNIQEESITELRRKISRLGSVNLEAIDELQELEQRESHLQSQHNDLTDARNKLQAIIDQINIDSRRMFSETLATIRAHFQDLFRRLFAGGMADIILEDETDILESGIEITAKPPGKETRKISLLSGGEKALTAVALLLAVFRSKPSPFCILDEIDAAMDEANTLRLAELLRDFSGDSQYILITHKKRTMAVADVLYGVTMQESGISRQVSVRFEDWPEDSETESPVVA